MATILNLETATTNCSISIARNGKLLVLREHNSSGYSHSEQLHNFIREALEEVSIAMDGIDAIAVSKGPGSYTGLRIGVSSAKGLCFSLGLPLISVPTLESMAHQVKAGSNELIVPVLDARRMEVYSAVFDAAHNKIRETRAEIIDAGSFMEFAEGKRVHIVGSGAEKCRGILKTSNFIFDTSIIPSAKEMCLLSHKKYREKDFEDIAYFEPYYLKDFILQQHKRS